VIPAFRILADSVDVTAAIAKHLVSLRLTDKKGMEADQIDISIADFSGSLALPRKGVTLTVALGWKGEALTPKGTFTVDEVGEDGPPDVITITARSADFRDSLKDQREVSYSETTLGAILATVAARNGLSPAVGASLAATSIAHMDQTNESDANLLTRLGQQYGAIATVKAGHLLFVPFGAGLTASGAALSPVTIERKAGDRHSFRATDREGTTTGVMAKWHNLATGKTCFALAGEEGSTKTLKRIYPTQAEAQTAAEAAWTKRKRAAHEFRVTLVLGRPDIVACAPIVLSGWRPEITSLSWIAGDITHTMDGDGGFTTEIQAEEMLEEQ